MKSNVQATRRGISEQLSS